MLFFILFLFDDLSLRLKLSVVPGSQKHMIVQILISTAFILTVQESVSMSSIVTTLDVIQEKKERHRTRWKRLVVSLKVIYSEPRRI